MKDKKKEKKKKRQPDLGLELLLIMQRSMKTALEMAIKDLSKDFKV